MRQLQPRLTERFFGPRTIDRNTGNLGKRPSSEAFSSTFTPSQHQRPWPPASSMMEVRNTNQRYSPSERRKRPSISVATPDCWMAHEHPLKTHHRYQGLIAGCTSFEYGPK
jgi:hypothetical protein